MCLIKTVKELNVWFEQNGRKTLTLGFVPTMGCLHEGHLSLIKEARAHNDIVAVSVFVNPTQFGRGEDFEKYPRDINRDCKLAMDAGADIIFNPEAAEIYIPGASTEVEVTGEITQKLCGASRPGHFKGVTTVVSILLNIVRPDTAYFGQKDAQQALIIKKMVRELHVPVEMVICPIVREADGLAMSSRNIYLNTVERSQATVLNRALRKAQGYLDTEISRAISAAGLAERIKLEIQTEALADIDYVQVLDSETLDDLVMLEPGRIALAAVAVRFGKTRLIDNRLLSN